MLKKAVVFWVFSIFALPALASYGLSGDFTYGNVRGFLQTPQGGTPGTSSYKRPSLKELGIKHSADYHVHAWYDWRKIRFFGDVNIIHIRKSTTLQNSLTTHGVLIPAGSKISSKVNFDWYQLGAGYNFIYHKLHITPFLSCAVLNFKYLIKNYIKSRNYREFTPRIGVSAQYPFNNKLFLSGKIAASIPGINLNIITAQAKLNYLLINSHKIKPVVFVGTRYTYIDFKDKQTMPNYVRYIMSPAVVVGLSLAVM
ncbi:MAG: hypothetical protein JXR42_03265 [Gammaproteobacteria bacterium]|nr:hypothetical protein [Gammaproteobacteria bacterium]